MDPQDEKVTPKDAAASELTEEEAARKREEAIRKVDAMLTQNRANIDQHEINLNNRRSWAAAMKRMNMPEPRDYGTEMLESYHPPKPPAEMAPGEAETERKKAEAIARVAAMVQQQQANDAQRYGQIDRKYARNRLQFRRPKVSENSVDIQGFLSQYKLSPEAQERYAKMRFGMGKGMVRPAFSARLGLVAAPVMMLLVAWVLGMFPSMSAMKPFFILLALLLLPVTYYTLTWKLEYDSEAGIVKYHSLFHGTNLYEIKDMANYMICRTPDRPFPLSALSFLDPRQYLVIRTLDHTINIPLLFSKTILWMVVELDGYTGARDFQNCLEQYTRQMYRKQAEQESAEKPSAPAPKPAVPEKPVIPEKPVTPEKPAAPKTPAPVPKPVQPAAEAPKPAPKPVPTLSPEELAKAREMFAQPAPSVLSMPERSTDFPDPTKSAFPDPAQSSFPDPAQKPKPDVDALFNQVLRDHGKLN